MDAFGLLTETEQKQLNPAEWAHWTARLSMSIVLNLPSVANIGDRQRLRRTVDEFLASGLPSEELQRSLRGALR